MAKPALVESAKPDHGAVPASGDDARRTTCVRAFQEQFDFVYRSVRRYGASAADTDDVVQEVFIAMWRRWSDFDASRPLRPWVAGIAFRVTRCYVRRHRADPKQVLLDDAGPNGVELPDPAQDSDKRHAASHARALVLAVLERLPERHRLPLVMHELDELTPGEIAAQLSIPVSTVYTRIARARRAFAKIVSELQRDAVGGAQLALLPPSALLGIERVPPAAPALVRQRASEFARQVVRMPEPPLDPLAQLLPTSTLSSSTLARWLGGRVVITSAIVSAILTGAGVFGWLALRDRGLVAQSSGAPVTAGAAAAGEPGAAPAQEKLRRAVGQARTIPALRANVAPVVPPAPNATALGKGLLGHWPLDDGPGAKVARDVSGAGRDCAMHVTGGPATWVDGVHGRALSFERRTWLECPQPPVASDVPVDITVSAWVKRLPAKAHAAVVTRQIGRSFHDQFFFGFGPDKLRVLSHTWAGLAELPVPPVSPRWFHTAFTHERQGTTRLYVDGIEVSHNVGQPLAIGKGDITNPITIGAGQYAISPLKVRQLLDGAVDDVMIYDRVLAPEEVSALAAGARPPAK